MSETKFTPGPWTERNRTDDIATIQGAGGQLIADVNLIHHSKCGNADARLIAAAPELLSALDAICWLPADDEGNRVIPAGFLDDARAAIQKAIG